MAEEPSTSMILIGLAIRFISSCRISVCIFASIAPKRSDTGVPEIDTDIACQPLDERVLQTVEYTQGKSYRSKNTQHNQKKVRIVSMTSDADWKRISNNLRMIIWVIPCREKE